MIYKDFQDLKLSALGMGCMRLPVVGGNDAVVDEAAAEEFGLVILKTVMENGEELLSTLDSDEELNRVYDLFMEQILSDEEENS